MKRYYECTFIVSPGLDDPQTAAAVESVKETIEKSGGEIKSVEDIGRRRLAYPITKKHNGYFTSIEFEAEPHAIEQVERYMKLDENIMRYLTLQLEARELKAMRDRAAARAAELEAREQAKAEEEEKLEQKAEEQQAAAREKKKEAAAAKKEAAEEAEKEASDEAASDEKPEAEAEEKPEAEAEEKPEAEAEEKPEAEAEEKPEAEAEEQPSEETEKAEAATEEKKEDD